MMQPLATEVTDPRFRGNEARPISEWWALWLPATRRVQVQRGIRRLPYPRRPPFHLCDRTGRPDRSAPLVRGVWRAGSSPYVPPSGHSSWTFPASFNSCRTHPLPRASGRRPF